MGSFRDRRAEYGDKVVGRGATCRDCKVDLPPEIAYKVRCLPCQAAAEKRIAEQARAVGEYEKLYRK